MLLTGGSGGEGKSKSFPEFLDRDRLRFLFGNVEDLDKVATGKDRRTIAVSSSKVGGPKQDFHDRGVVKSGHDVGV